MCVDEILFVGVFLLVVAVIAILKLMVLLTAVVRGTIGLLLDTLYSITTMAMIQLAT